MLKVWFRIFLLPIRTKNRGEKEEDIFRSKEFYNVDSNGIITKNKAKPFNYLTYC